MAGPDPSSRAGPSQRTHSTQAGLVAAAAVAVLCLCYRCYANHYSRALQLGLNPDFEDVDVTVLQSTTDKTARRHHRQQAQIGAEAPFPHLHRVPVAPHVYLPRRRAAGTPAHCKPKPTVLGTLAFARPADATVLTQLMETTVEASVPTGLKRGEKMLVSGSRGGGGDVLPAVAAAACFCLLPAASISTPGTSPQSCGLDAPICRSNCISTRSSRPRLPLALSQKLQRS